MIQILILSVVCCLAALAVAGFFVRRYLLSRTGRLGKSNVSAILRKFSRMRFYKTFDDITLSAGGKSCRVDHVMVGFFGVLLIKTLEESGDYFGSVSDKNWIHVVGESQRTSFANPVLELEEASVVLRALFSNNGIYRVPVETAVVFCGRSRKTEINISGHIENLVRLSQLSAYLAKAKFEKDSRVDVDVLSKLFDTCRG